MSAQAGLLVRPEHIPCAADSILGGTGQCQEMMDGQQLIQWRCCRN